MTFLGKTEHFSGKNGALKGNSGVKMNLFQRNGQLVRVPFALPVLSSGLSSGICFG